VAHRRTIRPAIKSKTVQSSIVSSASAIAVAVAILPKLAEISSVLRLTDAEQTFVALAGVLSSLGPLLAIVFRVTGGGPLYTPEGIPGPNKPEPYEP
jgi:hypothetical protein